MTTIVNHDYTAKVAATQMSYQQRYQVIGGKHGLRDHYLYNTREMKHGERRDHWIELADGVDDEIERDLVELFGFSRDEVADYWAMTGRGWGAEFSVEKIVEAREAADHNATINSLIWAM